MPVSRVKRVLESRIALEMLEMEKKSRLAALKPLFLLFPSSWAEGRCMSRMGFSAAFPRHTVAGEGGSYLSSSRCQGSIDFENNAKQHASRTNNLIA